MKANLLKVFLVASMVWCIVASLAGLLLWSGITGLDERKARHEAVQVHMGRTDRLPRLVTVARPGPRLDLTPPEGYAPASFNRSEGRRHESKQGPLGKGRLHPHRLGHA
ncbi:MAG: hypothetical protein ABIR26_11730 [Ramlibacter sp.]